MRSTLKVCIYKVGGAIKNLQQGKYSSYFDLQNKYRDNSFGLKIEKLQKFEVGQFLQFFFQ